MLVLSRDKIDNDFMIEIFLAAFEEHAELLDEFRKKMPYQL